MDLQLTSEWSCSLILIFCAVKLIWVKFSPALSLNTNATLPRPQAYLRLIIFICQILPFLCPSVFLFSRKMQIQPIQASPIISDRKGPEYYWTDSNDKVTKSLL